MAQQLADTIEESLHANKDRTEKIRKQFVNAKNFEGKPVLPNYESKKIIVEDQAKEAAVKAEKFSEWLKNMRKI